MTTRRIIGVDPGFAWMGLVEAKTSEGRLTFTRGWTIHTEKGDAAIAVDMFHRAQEIARQLPDGPYDVAVVESMSHPPSASSGAKLGCSHGVLAYWSAAHECPVILLSPQAIRRTVCDSLSVPPEAEAHETLLLTFPELRGIVAPLKKAQRPHVLDAAAAVVAAYMHESEAVQ